MIDIDKYEGHTEGPWWAGEWFNDDVVQFERGYGVEQRIVNESPFVDHSGEWVCLVDNEADAKLIADAPLLLAEVKRLRDMLSELASQHGQLLLEVNTLNEIIDTERKKVYDIAQKLLEVIE